ncbi:MAG: hypothetical protein NZO16_05780, partial [Deltaproteobacteria bacterium]|nr:hypothetical protein [Deltaproteobacteria bacterium]
GVLEILKSPELADLKEEIASLLGSYVEKCGQFISSAKALHAFHDPKGLSTKLVVVVSGQGLMHHLQSLYSEADVDVWSEDDFFSNLMSLRAEQPYEFLFIYPSQKLEEKISTIFDCLKNVTVEVILRYRDCNQGQLKDNLSHLCRRKGIPHAFLVVGENQFDHCVQAALSVI